MAKLHWPGDFINKIVCGDCLEVTQQMPNECVDLVIADPPFNKGLNYGPQFNDSKSSGEYWKWLEIRIKEIYRVLKDEARLYIFNTDKGIFKLKPICEKLGLKYHQTLIWFGPNMCNFGGISGDWHFMHENILLFRKGKRTPMLNAEIKCNCFSVQTHVRPQSNFKGGRDHPAQKPVSLMSVIIARTPGKIILDPFCGVGSSLIAAKNLKRNFLGIEINPDYCAIARERLAQGVL